MRNRYLSPVKYAVQISTSGDNTVLTAPTLTAHEYVVTFLQVQNNSSSDTTALVKVGGSTVLPVVMPAKGDGEVLILGDDNKLRCGAGNALIVNLSGANAVWVTVWYYEEPAQ